MNEDNRLERGLEQFYEQVPPPPQGLKAGRERFLAQAARLPKERPSLAGARVQTKPRRRKMKLALAYKIVAAILAVVMGTAAVGGGVAYAASDSLPGEPLYPVKLTVEDVRLAWTAGPAARARLGMTFAAERAREMQQLAQQGKSVPETVPARMAKHMEQTMAQIAESRPEDIPALLEQVMTQTRAQEQVLEQVQAKGAQGSQAAFQHALESARRAYETASTAQGDPNRYQNEYQHRYQGTPGPHGTATPQPQQQQKQKQGDGGQQNRVQNQEQNSTVTPTVTPQQNQNREQNRAGTPTVTPQQNKEQNREQNGDGSAGAPSQNQHQERNNTVTPTVTPPQNQHQERNNTVTPTATPQVNREQNGNGPTPTPYQNQSSNGGK